MVAFLPPRNVTVPLKLKVLPELEVAAIVTIAVPDTICCVILSTAMFVDVIFMLLVKVYCLAIFDVVEPVRVYVDENKYCDDVAGKPVRVNAPWLLSFDDNRGPS